MERYLVEEPKFENFDILIWWKVLISFTLSLTRNVLHILMLNVYLARVVVFLIHLEVYGLPNVCNVSYLCPKLAYTNPICVERIWSFLRKFNLVSLYIFCLFSQKIRYLVLSDIFDFIIFRDDN